MTATKNWFEVDKEGLSKLQERRGKEFVIYELVQNSWDTDAKKVEVKLGSQERGLASLVVTDDHPEGWKNLTHAWTLFAESEKKGNPEKRGRFNLGEKLVLALCKEATIETTTGGVRFDAEGRHSLRSKSNSGSTFSALIKMTREEIEDVKAAVKKLLPPPECSTIFNGEKVAYRKPLRVIEATLPTEVADAEGILKRSARKTMVQVVEVLPGEVGSVFEMGIPVVESGDKYHYNVMQKVPLNSERDNVTPSYLRDLRTLVLNAMYDDLKPEEVSETAVHDALADEDVSKEAVEAVMTLKFGEKRVVADPSDPEANRIAVTQGYTVIPPRSFSGAQWENIRKYGVALPAGQVTPSPKPFTPDGKPLQFVPEEKWTEAVKRVVAYAKAIAREILGHDVDVKVTSQVTWTPLAAYGTGHLTLNLGRLGHAWFEDGPCQATDELLIHEFGHEGGVSHLSEEYYDALCRLGAKLARLVFRKPELFKKHGWRV